jgi:hypothetical protein
MTSNDRVLMGLSIWVMGMVPVGMYNPNTLITQIDSYKNLGLIYGSYCIISCWLLYGKEEYREVV